jgi:acylphosphatase
MGEDGPERGGGLHSEKPLPDAAFTARVRGRVQGVGFRWSAREEAKRLGLTGWVRNADDGSVEVTAEGRTDKLEAFAVWLARGPIGARVDAVDRRDRRPTAAYRSFTVEP